LSAGLPCVFAGHDHGRPELGDLSQKLRIAVFAAFQALFGVQRPPQQTSILGGKHLLVVFEPSDFFAVRLRIASAHLGGRSPSRGKVA